VWVLPAESYVYEDAVVVPSGFSVVEEVRVCGWAPRAPGYVEVPAPEVPTAS
jgi:hypothetical protein